MTCVTCGEKEHPVGVLLVTHRRTISLGLDIQVLQVFPLPAKMFGLHWPRMCGLWVVVCFFFLFVSGKCERSLLYSSVFALSALSFTCSEKVCDGSRRGGLPCAAAFANTQLL